jgi:hypothetical protein
VYILAVFIGGALRHDYSPLYNSISELSMANAPNKMIFALGAYQYSSINSKKYNAATIMLIIIGVLGLLVLIFT